MTTHKPRVREPSDSMIEAGVIAMLLRANRDLSTADQAVAVYRAMEAAKPNAENLDQLTADDGTGPGPGRQRTISINGVNYIMTPETPPQSSEGTGL